MRTNILKIATSLAFALTAAQAFAHAQLEKATPAVGGTVASASEIRLEFSEGVEPKFTKVSLTGPGGAVPLGAAKTEPSNQAVLIVPIAKAAGGRRLHGALAGGLGRYAPYPGNLRIHGEAMTAAIRRSAVVAWRARRRQRCERRICPGPVRKGYAPSRQQGRFADRNPARIQRERRPSILRPDLDGAARRQCRAWRARGRKRRSARACGPDHERARARLLHRVLARRLVRQPLEPGRVQFHREAVMSLEIGKDGL